MLAHLNSRNILQCYRANEFSSFEIYPTQKKTKKVQKNLLRKTAGVSSPVYDMASVYTGPIEPFEISNNPNKEYRTSGMKKKKKNKFNLCECNDNGIDENHNHNYRYKTWDSITNYYGNADTTEVWPDPNNKKIKFQQGQYIEDNPIVYAIDKHRDYTKGSKKHKRKSKRHKKRGHHLQSQIISDYSANPVPRDTSVVSLFRKEKTRHQKAKPKDPIPDDLYVMRSFKNYCPDGVCAEQTKKNKSYLCKCIKKREPHLVTTECTDATCKLSRNSLSINSVVKIKDKFLCMCHKYSQKIINMKPHNNDVLNKDRMSMKSNLTKQANRFNDVVIKKEHESEQTGEPFFEIQVNPRDMCVLNPIEIKENIIKYGKPEKNEAKCICPSRGRLRFGEVCKGGPCKKAYKNKQVNFNCWCEKKMAECGDATCDVINIGNPRMKHEKGKLLKNDRVNKPLLEVQLDMDKMCVVNPKEIEEKIINNISVDDICSSGVCRDAALKHKIPYFCKCISKKIHSDITECKEDTCVDPTKKKKSKLCLFCYRLCSKSENWSHRDRNNNISQRRIKRSSFYEISPNKLCRGRICTQSDNLHERNGFRSNNMDIKHLPTCDCQECKNPSKSASLRPREKIEINKEHIPKLSLTHPNNENHTKNRMEDYKTELKNIKYKEKQQRRKLKQKRRSKENDDRNFEREAKRRAKLDKKEEIRAAKYRLKEIKLMQKKMTEEPLDTNFCTAFILGIVKVGVGTLIFIFTIIFKILKNPKKAYWYVRDRIRDPEGTYIKLRKWFRDEIMMKKLQVSETVRGSDALTILSDHFMDTPFYQSFADKGKTKKEQMLFEQKSKARKRRIKKREQQALYSCRHTLLTTLRQTPCLWVYHICPNFYPQCLSLLSFMRSFSHVLMFLIAFACWTPCILSFELCRACLCCFMCTG